MDLAPGAAWLLVQGQERDGLHEPDTIASERSLDPAWVRAQRDCLADHGSWPTALRPAPGTTPPSA